MRFAEVDEVEAGVEMGVFWWSSSMDIELEGIEEEGRCSSGLSGDFCNSEEVDASAGGVVRIDGL